MPIYWYLISNIKHHTSQAGSISGSIIGRSHHQPSPKNSKEQEHKEHNSKLLSTNHGSTHHGSDGHLLGNHSTHTHDPLAPSRREEHQDDHWNVQVGKSKFKSKSKSKSKSEVLRVFYSILLVSYFMWSGALNSSGVLQSFSIISQHSIQPPHWYLPSFIF